MRKKTYVSVLAVVMSLVFVLVGCSNGNNGGNAAVSNTGNTGNTASGNETSGNTAEKTTGDAGGDTKYTIGVTLSQMSDPFFVNVRDGVFEEAASQNVTVQFADGQASAATQLSQVENFIAQKVDLIVLNPVEADPLGPAVLAANEAGIPVITFDRWVNSGETVTHVGASALEVGVKAGDALFEYLGGKGKIAVIEHIPGASTTIDRTKGLEEALKDAPDIEIVARQSATSRAEAMSVMENILTANPDIQGVYAYNDDNALGASDAIAAAQLQDKVVVVGVGGTAPALEAVEKGVLLATVDILPKDEGKLAISTAVKVLEGATITEQNEGRTWVLQESKTVTGPQWAAKMGQ